MKKILILFILLFSFGSYAQATKKCSCCNKVISKASHHKKKVVKKKTHVVKLNPVAPVHTEINIIINNTINYTPQKMETKVIAKDTVIKVVEKPIPVKLDKGPEFEVYTGVVDPKHTSGLGHMIGLNITPNLHQIGKNGLEREWLNRYLFGFEFSGYSTKEQTFETQGSSTGVVTTLVGCNCDETTFGDFKNGSKYTFKQDVLGLSLNFGVEIYKGWYLTSGVTAYRRKLILDGKSIDTVNSMFIDAGIKKFFKVGNVFLSPMFKFNEQTTSFGLGFSYD